jgi:hypothetical protein
VGKIESEECHFERNQARQAHNVSIGSSQDRSGSAGTMGEGEAGGLEEQMHQGWTYPSIGESVQCPVL